MATIGVHSLFGNIQTAIDYIADENKTEPGMCEGKNINIPIAKYEWSSFKENKNETLSSYDKVTGYHFRQAFAAGTATSEEVYEIAKEWIEAVTGGHHNYVISVHTDKDHIHAHIIVDPMNNLTKKRWRIFYKRDLQTFKDISDRICLEHGKDILNEEKVSKSKTYHEWLMSGKKQSNKDIIKSVIDKTIPLVSSYDELKSSLIKLGFEVEDGIKQDTVDNRLFSFSINEKMFNHDRDHEDEFCVRLPYTRNYIYLRKEKCQFTSDGKTCFTTIDLNDDFEVYDQSGRYKIENGVLIKAHWEGKKEQETQGRQGLRIKVPNGKKFIRCSRIDEQYSLDNVIKRIDEEGLFVADPYIQKILDANEEEIKKLKKEFYADAGIEQTDIYQEKTKQQKFYEYKISQIQDILDKSYLNNLDFESTKKDIKIINELRNYKKELIHQLDQVNHMLKQAEEKYEQIQEDIIEDDISNANYIVNKYINENIAPLRQKRQDLKNMIANLNERISKVETIEKKKQTQR